MPLLARAVAAAPQRAEVRALHGVALLQSGRADVALPDLEAAARALPQVADVQYNLGLALAALERPADAEPRFAAALALEPKNLDARYQRAHALLATAKFEDARDVLEELLKLAPDHVDGHYLMGRLLIESRRTGSSLKEARSHLDAVVRAAPRHAAALAELGVVDLEEGQVDAAIARLREAVALAPEDPLARWQLARALRKGGQADAAKAELEAFRTIEHVVRVTERLERLVHRSPGDVELRLRLASERVKAGEREAARAELEQVLRLAPGEPRAAALLAELSK